MERQTANRRQLLTSAVAGALTLWAAPRVLRAQQTATVSSKLIAKNLALTSVIDCNMLAFSTGEGLVLVDSGPPQFLLLETVKKVFPDAKVQMLFNTHYHGDQTGNNEAVAAAGAKI